MREILFRGKRIDNGELVYGDLFTQGGIRAIRNKDLPNYSDLFEVDPATVGQFTGLRDKDDKRIFEGDIVHCQATFDNANMVVIWEEGDFHMVLCEEYKSYLPLCGYYCIRNFAKEVIGNIHDNPELLKGGPADA